MNNEALTLTPSQLIPETYLELLQQVRGLGDVEFWSIGDIATSLEDEASDNPKKKRAVRQAIADVSGVLPDTVLRYKNCAEFFPPEVREQYVTLTRYHFRAARSAGSLDAAKSWLTKAVESADNYGVVPMPVRTLTGLIADARDRKDKVKSQKRQLANNIKRAESALDRAISLSSQLELPKGLRDSLFAALASVQDVSVEWNEQK